MTFGEYMTENNMREEHAGVDIYNSKGYVRSIGCGGNIAESYADKEVVKAEKIACYRTDEVIPGFPDYDSDGNVVKPLHKYYRYNVTLRMRKRK